MQTSTQKLGLSKGSAVLTLLLNLTAWLGAGLGPVAYAWRGRRDLAVALLILVLQVVFGIYTWRLSAAYLLEKVECFTRKT